MDVSWCEHGPLQLTRAWWSGGSGVPDWPQFRGRDVVLTHLSRVAIALATRALRLRPGDEVLVPAYNCGSEIDPLLARGLRPVLYRVDAAATLDLDDLRRRVGRRTRAVYVTHFFGFPQPVRELAAWCRGRGLALVEDCALGLFSAGPEGPLGTVADAAIHCLWKMLPVPDGGALVLPPGAAAALPRLRPPDARDLARRTRPFLERWARSRARPFLPRSARRGRAVPVPGPEEGRGGAGLPDMPADWYFDERLADRGASRLTLGLLRREDPGAILRARREAFLALLDAARDLRGADPLFGELPEGVCPLAFPLRVDDRARWLAGLRARGVFPFPWWSGYHRALSWQDHPEARALKDGLLAFHVDPGVGAERLALVAKALREVAAAGPGAAIAGRRP